MSEGYRGGSTSHVWSIRFQAMEAALAAPAFVVMKIRPALVPAQTTFRSDGAGVFIEMRPPERSSPQGYGAGQGTVQGSPGVAAGGHAAAGPRVSRPRWPGSPIAFQSSHTSIAGSYVPFSSMSPSPIPRVQCSFPARGGEAG